MPLPVPLVSGPAAGRLNGDDRKRKMAENIGSLPSARAPRHPYLFQLLFKRPSISIKHKTSITIHPVWTLHSLDLLMSI